MPASKPTSGAAGTCPVCSRPTHADYRPFCSRRCADVDLSRWLSGAYAIPVEADGDEDGDDPARPETDAGADSEPTRN